MDSKEKWEEYRFFAESTQYLSDKRQAAAQTYLTVNTSIFAVMAFIIKDAGLREWALVGVSAPLFLTGIIVSYIWRRIILNYKELINFRFEQLKAIEKDQQDNGWHHFYLKEDLFYGAARPKKWKNFGFSQYEKNLPVLFMVLHLLYALALLGIAIAASIH